MAFTATKEGVDSLGNGWIIEYGNFVSTAPTTTGTITATAPNVDGPGFVLCFGGASSAGNTGVVCNNSGGNTLKLTFTAGDDGKYFLIGKAY
jgi:hypothetical protein